jgi:methylglutaconyl-CoA hydratase
MVASYVDALTAGGPQALARTKELLRRIPSVDLEEGFGITARMSSELFSSDEAREGMTAFIEKRRPAWAPDA